VKTIKMSKKMLMLEKLVINIAIITVLAMVGFMAWILTMAKS
jgi:hypothetical protein